MPPHLPTTSPVAVAANRILTAYLSNHKLSAAEAANLSGAITAVLAALVAGRSATSPAPIAQPEATTPGRRGRKAETRATVRRRPQMAVEAEAVVEAAVEAAHFEAEPERVTAQPEPEPVGAEPGLEPVAAKPEPAVAPVAAEPDPVSGPALPAAPETALASETVPEPEAAVSTAAPGKKRKRPSRPRSRRGQGRAVDAAQTGTAENGTAENGASQDADETLPDLAVDPAAADDTDHQAEDAGEASTALADVPDTGILPAHRARRVTSS